MHGDIDQTAPVVGDEVPALSESWSGGSPLLMKLEPAAEALGGISVRELRRRARDGDVEMVHIGRAAFITRRSIEEYVERLCQETAARLERLRSGSLGNAS